MVVLPAGGEWISVDRPEDIPRVESMLALERDGAGSVPDEPVGGA